jgi:hypothetical protein
MSLGGGVWGLATWADHQPDRTPVADSTSSAPPEEWPTYSSPQYPVTFQYPPDWTVGDLGGGPAGPFDGCDTVNCRLFVSPPSSSSVASIELIRNGFPGTFPQDDGAYAPPLPADVEVLESVPGMAGWGLDKQDDGPAQVVVVRSEDEEGNVDYSLTVAGSALSGLALGDQNPLPDHPEAAFSFMTNVGNIGGESDGESMRTLVAILASIQPNPGFAPTPPEGISLYDAMSTPAVDVTPDSSWKTFTSQAGNVTVRYPSTWTVTAEEGFDDSAWIVAPSGYSIGLLTQPASEPASEPASDGSGCGDNVRQPEVLKTVDQAQVQSKGRTGAVEVRWVNGGGESPVWIGLTPSEGSAGCYYASRDLNFGGVNVYLGSGGNLDNPTPGELDQAVAILASARRAS